MAKHGKKYREAVAKVEQRPYPLRDAIALAKDASYVKFDETLEVVMRLRVSVRPADQDGARHGRAAQRSRQDGARPRLRQRREDPRGARRPGPISSTARTWPSREDRGRLDGSRGGGGDAGHDAGRRPPRQGARPAQPDAQSEGRHGGGGRRQGGERDQGRQGGGSASTRPGILHVPVGKLSFERRPAEGERRRARRRGAQGQAQRGQGQVRVRTGDLSSTMGPGIKVDESAMFVAREA